MGNGGSSTSASCEGQDLTEAKLQRPAAYWWLVACKGVHRGRDGALSTHSVCQGKRSNRVTAGSRKQPACMVMILSGREGGETAGSREGSDTRRAAGGLMGDLTANHVENMGFGPNYAAPCVKPFGQIHHSQWPRCREMVTTSSFRCFVKVKAIHRKRQ